MSCLCLRMCVCLCVCVSECVLCSLDNRSSVPDSGGGSPNTPETSPQNLIGQLQALRSLLQRMQFAGFCFQLNVECSALEGHLKCVFVCVCIVCVHLPSHSLTHALTHSLYSFSNTEVVFCMKSPLTGEMPPNTLVFPVIFGVCLALRCQFSSSFLLPRPRVNSEHIHWSWSDLAL